MMLLITFLFVCATALCASEGREISHPLYGSCLVAEPVLIDLLESKALQRLRGINQYGVVHYTHKRYDYTRYDHSVGVFMLLRRFDASLEEQIAGLLHDVSHTAFSHVADYLYCKPNTRGVLEVEKNGAAYQDDIFVAFLQNTDVAEILARHGISIDVINPHNGMCTMLEQELPDVCADRLEYTLFGAYRENKLTQKDVEHILASLTWQDGHWLFSDHHAARLFADSSLYLTEHIFASAWNNAEYEWTACALRYAIEHNLLSVDAFAQGTDDDLWCQLCAIQESVVKELVCTIASCTLDRCTTNSVPRRLIKSKFRGIDPLVIINGTVQRLSAYDARFYDCYHQLKNAIAAGSWIPDANAVICRH